MDPAEALADLTEISSQIRAAALIDESGRVAASTLDDPRAGDFAAAARDLLAAAESVRQAGGEALVQLEVATAEGSVFIVRDGGTTIAATTSAEPTVGLVFYDLKSCLRSLAEQEPEQAQAAQSAEAEVPTGPSEPAEAEPAAEQEPAKPRRARSSTEAEEDGGEAEGAA